MSFLKVLLSGFAFLFLASCAETGPAPVADMPESTGADMDETAPEAPPASVPSALTFDLTSYDDGRSCPGDCDAHVVFHSSHNGSANAFAPAAGDDPLADRADADARKKCVRGEACAICFNTENASCLVTTYRGSGPPRKRFDVTPAFLKEWCGREPLPATLAAKCESHMAAAARLAAKTNCIATPEDPACVDAMSAAIAAKEEDTPRYNQCKAMGQSAYNAAQEDDALKREHGCAYWANRRHPSDEWILLTPGACKEGYYVGRDGLDCCSADPVQAAIDPLECSPYYK